MQVSSRIRVASIALFAFVAAAPAAPAQETGTIAGVVLDASTGAPVASATVAIFNDDTSFATSVATAPDGTYQTAALPSASYYVSATAFRYVSQVSPGVPCRLVFDCRLASGTPVAVTAGANTTLNFALTPAATITGAIKDAVTGQSLNVTVVLTPPGFSLNTFPDRPVLLCRPGAGTLPCPDACRTAGPVAGRAGRARALRRSVGGCDHRRGRNRGR